MMLKYLLYICMLLYDRKTAPSCYFVTFLVPISIPTEAPEINADLCENIGSGAGYASLKFQRSSK